jgi:hypothetical protein
MSHMEASRQLAGPIRGLRRVDYLSVFWGFPRVSLRSTLGYSRCLPTGGRADAGRGACVANAAWADFQDFLLRGFAGVETPASLRCESCCGGAARRGSAEGVLQGLKPTSVFGFTARVNSCPDTSCGYRWVIPQPAKPPSIFGGSRHATPTPTPTHRVPRYPGTPIPLCLARALLQSACAAAGGVGMGFAVSHPFAKNANGWGTQRLRRIGRGKFRFLDKFSDCAIWKLLLSRCGRGRPHEGRSGDATFHSGRSALHSVPDIPQSSSLGARLQGLWLWRSAGGVFPTRRS